MKHGSLFSGIGGFDLAAQWMGWENVFHCEWNEFGQRVLNHYWPNAISYGDITKTDFTIHAGQIDVLTGGFPCQPYSTAGKRLGKEDDRHLWPEMLRAIREIQPRWVVGENVLGIVSWNEGLVFNEVQLDLEAEGYEVQPYVLPACAVNAPHRRDRVWVVAYANHPGAIQPVRDDGNRPKENRGREWQLLPEPRHSGRDVAKSNEPGRQELNPSAQPGWAGYDSWEIGGQWRGFPTQPPVCGRNDGVSPGLAGITVSKHRNESIKAYGNAIVPQVAIQIFKAIQQYEKL